MNMNDEHIDIMEPVFRVSVCLSRFFNDERSLCYVSVQGRQPVRWLRRRLRRLFGPALPRRLCLRSRGHLLPPDEPLSLLRPDDPVEVIPLPVTCDWAFGDKFFQTSRDLPVSEPENDPKKIRKNVELQKETYDDENSINMLDADITDDCHNINQKDNDVTDGINGGIQTPPEDRELRHVKEQALALLQTCEIKSQNIMDSFHSGGTKRVRRRVRRRRPRALDTTCSTNSEAPSPNISDQYNTISQSQSLVADPAQLSMSAPVAPVTCNSLVPQPFNLFHDHTRAPTIVRNDAVMPRKARVVRTLDSEPEFYDKESEKISQESSVEN